VNAPKIKAALTSSKTCSGLSAADQLINLGTDIYLNNGVINSTYDAAEAALPGKCWMVPVIPNSTKCNGTDAITGWASVCVSVVTKDGAAGDKYIKGDVTCGQSLYRTDSNLCFSSRLLRDTKSGM